MSSLAPSSHYFNQASHDINRTYPLSGKVAGHIIHLQSAKGLFSAQEFDKASSLLLEYIGKHNPLGLSMQDHTTVSILDLGCGYGLVSLRIATHYATYAKKIKIDAVDSSPLAKDITEINLRAVQKSLTITLSYHVIVSDILDNTYFQEKRYHCIISNPPFSAGKKVVQQFISQSYQHLHTNGQLRLVAPTNKGAKSYITYTQEIFSPTQVEIIAVEKGIRVWKATKSSLT